MYAVIKTGGKQHKVAPGDVIEVERLVADGETITFQPLMVVDDDGKTHVGTAVAKATVTAKPLGEKKGEKVRVFKYRPKSGYARRAGHRQMLTMLEIAEVKLASRASAKKDTTTEPADDATSTEPKAKATTTKKAVASEKATASKKPAAKSKAATGEE